MNYRDLKIGKLYSYDPLVVKYIGAEHLNDILIFKFKIILNAGGTTTGMLQIGKACRFNSKQLMNEILPNLKPF